MKKLLTILLVALSLTTMSQTTINPDTVCANAVGEQYFVTNVLITQSVHLILEEDINHLVDYEDGNS